MSGTSWILSHRWAILPGMLETILSVASREASITELREAIATKDADPLPGARKAEVRDGVAIIPVIGPIFPRANLFTWVSGGVSIQTLAKDFAVALADPNVGAIMLNIDSPGGEVTGVHEFAAMVRAARSIKPITAYVLGTGASAAYWIASAAGQIVVDATAEIGSIGVVCVYQKDKSGKTESFEIVSSQSPRKRPDPATPEGRAQIQTVLDDMADVFVSTVAANRNVSVDKVLSDFGQGGTFIGRRAVESGMVDSIGSFESTLANMKSKIAARKALDYRY